jgi:hypothetical protein
VTEACFSSDTNQIILQEPTENSILCENEQVWSLVEVAKDRLVIHLANKDILLTKGWEPTQRVIEPDAGNTGKHHLFPIMDFDAVNFPIVLMSGQRTLNILNIEEASMQPLLKIPTYAWPGSSIAFILREDNGFSLHVARRHMDDENN